MSVRVSGGNIGFVQFQRPVHQGIRKGMVFSQFLEKVRDGMPPGLCSHLLEDGPHGLLRRLLGREAGPVVKAPLPVAASVLQGPCACSIQSRLRSIAPPPSCRFYYTLLRLSTLAQPPAYSLGWIANPTYLQGNSGYKSQSSGRVGKGESRKSLQALIYSVTSKGEAQ